ncbi:HAMP domain-containing histidine kinase [Candidatus Dojkabacteria bacterium]|uniref:histidine kinase n=1 Tax=Candidatus Dojkabacteria bacterium TaxID=2099670 RepID=A0A955L9R5_9BACT|nr:HAMP domain-containing histidine kinase [Candidatus Dojkabacteria bacterium]
MSSSKEIKNMLRYIKLQIVSFFRKTSVKIALVISFTMLTLLSLLNIAVIERSRSSFVDVVNTIAIGPISKRMGMNGEEVKQYNILRFYQDGSERPKPLQEEFVESFQSSLISIGVITVLVSFFIGFLASQFFVRPLRVLSTGMRKLKDNDYRLKLKNTGAEEFDEVICEFNHLTDELARIEKIRKDLILDTSHELKTPITSLLGQLQGIKDGVLNITADRTDLLIAQVHRLSDIVERLQEFSRLQSKQLRVKKSKVNLKTLVKTLVKQFKTELDENNIRTNINIPDTFEVYADKELLMQVFTNLLSNAIKYSKASNIKIYLKNNNNTIVFQDNGIGILDEHKKYIFERFYRVEKSRNRKTGGLGLGLAIVKELITSHDWKIVVKDTPNGGATFEINMS